MELGIQGRTALVLGSTGGLGWAIARGLADEGADVVVVGRDEARAHERASSLPSATAVTADLTEPGAPARILEAARAAYGEVDILVLNGGGPTPGTAGALTGADVDRTVGLLLRPHVELVNAVLPGMSQRGWGRIVAVGSSGVQQPIPNLTASNVGRAALAGYLKTLAGEVADQGITVNMVLPGRIDTDRVAQLDRAAAERTGSTPQEARTAAEATIPTGRYGTPEEFAAVAVFLAGEPAAYVTGEQVRCDGGLVRAH
ncbi:MAG: SDR family oxidoreductase [Actinomycetota bacterium]|jgi:3-oxoacyl-[acyl-carrier protein] reductase|nr:SDR family oxidoreductase [Actinomycetota bacterium]